MAYTPGGIWFEELAGSPRIRLGRKDGVSGERNLRCAWDDYADLCYELLGVWSLVGAIPQFTQPMSFPGMGTLVVDSIDVEPFDSESPDGGITVDLSSQANTYASGAKVTAHYATMWLGMYPAPAGTTLDLSGDEGAEMLTIPGRTFQGTYQSGGGTVKINMPDDVNVGIVQPTGNHVMSWGRVPAPNWNSLRELRGKVNANIWFGAPPETVMYLGFSYRRQFQLFQDQGTLWQIDLKFAESVKMGAGGEQEAVEGGWNHFYFPARGWTRVVDKKTGEPPYDTADFDALFEFDTSMLPFGFVGS